MAPDTAPRRVTRPLRWWGDHPGFDLLIGATVGVATAMTWLPSPTVKDAGERYSMFASAGGIVAVLGGLASVSIAVFMGMTGARSRTLRAGSEDALVRNWVWTVVATALSALGCWLAQPIDASVGDRWSWPVVFGATTWCVVTSMRQAWLFRGMLRVAIRDETQPRGTPRPAPSPRPGPLRGAPPESDDRPPESGSPTSSTMKGLRL